MFQTKEQDKTSEIDPNEIEINYLPNKKLKIMRMLTKVRRTMHKQSENFNKDIENVRKYQAENTELKKRTEKFQRGIQHQTRLGRERICKLKDRAVECIQSEEQKEKSMEKKVHI